MPISVLCPGCSSRITAPDAAAGRNVKCPKCKSPMVIPGGSPTAPNSPPAAPVATARPAVPKASPKPASLPEPAPDTHSPASPFDFDSPSPPAASEPAASPPPAKKPARAPEPEPPDAEAVEEAEPVSQPGGAFDFDMEAPAAPPAPKKGKPSRSPRDEDEDEVPRPTRKSDRKNAVAETEPAASPPPARKPARPPEPEPPDAEAVEEAEPVSQPGGAFDFDTDAPAAPPAPKKGKPSRSPRDENEDDEPRQARRGDRKNAVAERDEDVDEQDDRPRRRKKVAAGKPRNGPPVLFTLAAAGAIGLGIIVATYFIAAPSDSKAEAPGGGSDAGSGVAGSGTKAKVPGGWVEFSDPDAGFKAYFPSKPESMGGDKGGPNAQKAYITNPRDQKEKVVCLVMVIPLPPAAQDQAMNAAIGQLSGDKGELTRKDTTLGGKLAVELVGTAPGGGIGGGKGAKTQGVTRLVKTDTGLVQVMIVGKDGPPSPELVNGFFDNFQFTK